MQFKIETGIPLPATRRGGIIDMLRAMKPGESFACPSRMVQSILTNGRRSGMKLTSRKINKLKTRIWRVK
jgi:hypothetical protein